MPKLTKKAFRALLEEWLEDNEDCTLDYSTIRYDEDLDAMTCEMEDGDGRSFLVHEEDGMIYVD